MLSAPLLPTALDDQGAHGGFVVRDANEQVLGYFYFDDEPQRRSANNRLTPRRGVHQFVPGAKAAGAVEDTGCKV